MEDEDDQENEKEDERDDGKQKVEGRVVESQATHNMQMTHEMKCADNQTWANVNVTLKWVHASARKCDVWGCSVHTPRQFQL